MLDLGDCAVILAVFYLILQQGRGIISPPAKSPVAGSAYLLVYLSTGPVHWESHWILIMALLPYPVPCHTGWLLAYLVIMLPFFSPAPPQRGLLPRAGLHCRLSSCAQMTVISHSSVFLLPCIGLTLTLAHHSPWSSADVSNRFVGEKQSNKG